MKQAETRQRFELGAQLADMQETVYRNTLAIAALIELLASEGVISRDALRETARRLDWEAERLIAGAPVAEGGTDRAPLAHPPKPPAS